MLRIAAHQLPSLSGVNGARETRQIAPNRLLWICLVLLVPLTTTAWADNHDDCESWCAGEGHDQCDHCSDDRYCGRGYSRTATFDAHEGDTYYACERNAWGDASDENLEDCQEYCDEQPRCAFCSPRTGCGFAYERMEFFGGFGESYSACRKAVSVNPGWPFRASPQPHHRALVVVLSGASAGGLEWFCEDQGDRLDERVLCISSYANTTTRSEVLANNIADLIDQMHRVSGYRPSLVLIGKSMGGCKLHHAASGTHGASDAQLQDRDIELFIGVDMSCGLQRHWEEGADDALTFSRNVRELLVFYQQIDRHQTGHRAYRYLGAPFELDIHVDVNAESFRLDIERRVDLAGTGMQAMCSDADHGTIDECAAVLDALIGLINRRARACRCAYRGWW